jgi:glycosyltransferase involved in cell wall biosynthesis
VIHVLHLPFYPPGIDFRPWAAEIEGFQLLRWLVLRLVQRVPASSIVVLTHTPLDRDLANDCASGTGIAVFQSRTESKLEAIADIAAAFPKHEVTWFCPELAFAPSDLLERVASHHASTANRYTRTSGLPELVGCEIANARLLAAIGALNYEAGAPDPSAAFAELIQMRKDATFSDQIRADPFDVREHYGQSMRFPEIAVVTRHDADRARRCLVDLPADNDFGALQRWASEQVPTYLPPFSEGPCAEGWPKILFAEAYSGYSGAEECLQRLARGLSTLGFRQFALIGLEGLLATRLRESGVSVACPNWELNRDTKHAYDLADYVIATARPDLIHCNNPPGPALLRRAHSKGIPITSHVRMATLNAWAELLAESTRVIAVSQFVQRKLETFGVPPDRIDVVYDGIDTEHFYPGAHDKSAIRSRFGIPQDAFLVLMIARLDALKRHDLLIDAAARAIKSVPSLFLVFVGKYGDLLLRRRLGYHASACGLSDRVMWLPFQKDIREVETAADVLVLCSENEALGTCVLEAMSLEKPVVVSDSGGICEVVEDGVSGIVIPAGNPDELARALVRLATGAEWATMLGHNARTRVLNGFTLTHYAEHTAEILRAVCLKH